MTKRLVSFVVPVYNEEDNVMPLYERVTAVMRGLESRFDYEFVFTDNRSTDKTPIVLARLAQQDRRVRVFRFSRNFGFQRSVLTGYLRANGNAAIQLDCDLQDPPELIPEMLRLWNEGYAVVYGIRRTRQERWHITFARRAFYRIIDWLSEDALPHDAGDFRLVDRCVLNELARIEDSQPYLRGTIAAMGFKQTGIPYDRSLRERGETKFPLRALITLAVDGILNHSIVPLRLATFTGLAVSVITFVGVVALTSGRLIFGAQWPRGFATLAVLQLMALSLNAMFLGVIGEYLGRVYQQVKRRPLTIIDQTWNAEARLAPASHVGEWMESSSA